MVTLVARSSPPATSRGNMVGMERVPAGRASQRGGGPSGAAAAAGLGRMGAGAYAGTVIQSQISSIVTRKPEMKLSVRNRRQPTFARSACASVIDQ